MGSLCFLKALPKLGIKISSENIGFGTGEVAILSHAMNLVRGKDSVSPLPWQVGGSFMNMQAGFHLP